MTRWIAKLAYTKIGGLTWWKSLGAVAAGLLVAGGMVLLVGFIAGITIVLRVITN